MLNVTQWSVITGFVSTVILLSTTVVRQKRFDRVDIGPLAMTYFSGSNIPAAIFLCWYVFDPDPIRLLEQTKLSGYEKYLSFSGMALLIVSLVGIWTLLKAAYERDAAQAQPATAPAPAVTPPAPI